MKADDKVEFEEGSKQKFTNFEFLKKEVEILVEQFDEVIEILRYNNLERKNTIEPEYFDDDEVFKRLENEE